MNIIKREVRCLGFQAGAWVHIPGRNAHPSDHAQKVIDYAKAMQRQHGGKVQIRTTFLDRSGICRASVASY